MRTEFRAWVVLLGVSLGAYNVQAASASGDTDANQKAVRKSTPLHDAAASGDTETIKLLVAAGGPVEARDDSEATPLHIAASKGHTKTITALIDAGASLEVEAGHPLETTLRSPAASAGTLGTRRASRPARAVR